MQQDPSHMFCKALKCLVAPTDLKSVISDAMSGLAG